MLAYSQWTLDILRPCYRSHFSPSNKLGDYIIYDAPDGAQWSLVLEDSFLDPSITCLRHLLPGSGTKWVHFTWRWIVSIFLPYDREFFFVSYFHQVCTLTFLYRNTSGYTSPGTKIFLFWTTMQSSLTTAIFINNHGLMIPDPDRTLAHARLTFQGDVKMNLASWRRLRYYVDTEYIVLGD
jgi:hypothetical protein